MTCETIDYENLRIQREHDDFIKRFDASLKETFKRTDEILNKARKERVYFE